MITSGRQGKGKGCKDMRLIFVCEGCKCWNELDVIRDEKRSNKYLIHEVNNMGLNIEVETENEVICKDDEVEISINEIQDYSDYFNAECEIVSINFKCVNCGDNIQILF